MNERMPALFVGHGSPMNAIEQNRFTKKWQDIAKKFPRPKAILAVSAHWYTHGIRIANQSEPKTIYDMYGFPQELYELEYPVKGSPALAEQTKSLIHKEVQMDNSWGIDHGSWSVLCHMYPNADVPVYQLSVDKDADPLVHFQIGQEISSLREQGVLIFGSGNVVHNLARLDWDLEGGYPFALEFDEYIKNHILDKQFQSVIEYKNVGKIAEYAFVTPDHFYPLLTILGAAMPEDKVTVFNEECIMGSLSMTGYLFL